MKVNYRILDVNEMENSIVVRYWTDIITEEFLATERDEQGNPILGDDGKPIRTRTDYNISFFEDYNPSETDIIFKLERSAPVSFLQILEYIESQPEKKIDMPIAKSLIGQTKSFESENIQPPSNNV